MFKILFIILILVLSVFFFENTKKSEFNVFGENNKEKGSLKFVEKKLFRPQPFNNTSFNVELSNLYYNISEKIILNNNLQFNYQPIVIINTKIFSCEVEKINSESICLSLSDCDEGEYCSQIEETPKLLIIGKEPIYSFVASENGILSKQVKLQPGEYEIIPNNDDVVSSNYCNVIELDGVSFQKFTMGVNLSQDKKSLLCINISDGCYGLIKNGETKVCEINKVFIKNFM